ncbi:dTDP-4-dehydrorhamnose 3,5-epimerase family protein [Haliea sp. E17]|uniref:dTDP-4-dehydrorhamnose 3,5-epimerase family protein n=1 Tax=Haliea sp. E17 TaxID=3401576 RepID=UPI003AB0EDDD
MSRFVSRELPLSGLMELTRQKIGDERGYLQRVFCSDELAGFGWPGPVAQVNHTYTARLGTVRGMHFQREPYADAKLVSVLRGQVWDVAVDLRQDSATYLDWYGVLLCAERNNALLLPAGFAHGFQTLTDDVELIYCHSKAYAPEFEDGLNPLDRRLSINWPVDITVMSERDSSHPEIGAPAEGDNS